ncbi:phage major capsid protein [Aureimonas sp. ME7]|uniref:phage major capsid protein n=1 Tax=Aureimonas sp. ME7 TaxID=2744252 RepID=UPI001FCEA384|nr:phage major capsid protein [Aureimonas sp. ME7]
MKNHALMSAASAAALCAGLETRDEGNDDPLAAATAAVEELRSANENFRTEQTAAAERHATEVRGLTDRLTSLETRLNRPGGGGGNDQTTGPALEVRAFDTFVRRGRELLGADEVRALRTDSQVAGGYLAPDQFEATILKELVRISPIRAAARVTSVSSGAIILPKRTGRITAKWVGEVETRPATEPTYGQIELPVHEMACYVDVSNRLLEDAAVNMEAELSADFAEEFGRLEGEAFVIGDGVKKPVGILNDTSVTGIPISAAAANSKDLGDALISLIYDVAVQYRNTGAFLMNGTTIAFIRKLKDAGGNYMWMDSIREGEPATLLGRPVLESADMPALNAGPGTSPVVYGDIGAAYRILDRVGLTVLRDPYTQQVNGLVRFHARRRVGGGVVRPDAVRKLNIN